MNKQVLASVLALGVIVSVGYFGSSYVLASEGRPHDNLVQAIAQKFNLNESDVEAVFTAVRDEKVEEMNLKREEKLNQAVQDGVISESQKSALLQKMQEQYNNREKDRELMQEWFKSQGIDELKLREYLGFGRRFGAKMPR